MAATDGHHGRARTAIALSCCLAVAAGCGASAPPQSMPTPPASSVTALTPASSVTAPTTTAAPERPTSASPPVTTVSPTSASPATPAPPATAGPDTTTAPAPPTLPRRLPASPLADPGRATEVRTEAVDREPTPAGRSWFVLSAPTSPGRRPLAVVLHGAHGFCLPPSRPRAWPCAAGNEDPNHLGLVWLTEALAAAGFVAVAPGVNAAFAGSEANALDGPAERVAAIVRRDVTGPLQRGEHLVDWLEPSGIDLEHVVVIGHSRGGAVAAVLGRAPELAVGAPPRATVMIAPTSDTVDPSTLVDRPTAVLLGTCDGDTGVDGGEFVSAALGQARRSPIALVMAEGALHNATNSRLDDELMPDGRPGCEPGARLEDEAQRVRYGRIVPEMARALLGLAASPPIGEALLAPTRPDDRAAPALRLVHVDPAAARTRLVSPLQGWPVPGVEVAGFAVIACPGGLTSAFRAPGTEDCHRGELQEVVGRPPGIRLAWRGPGARMRLAAPAATPAVLVLRVIADPLSLPAGVSVRLRVAAGSWASDLTIPVPTVGDPIPPSGVRRGAVLWSERRVVLPPTSEVEITVESPGAGAVEVVGIDLVELPTLAASAPAAP